MKVEAKSFPFEDFSIKLKNRLELEGWRIRFNFIQVYNEKITPDKFFIVNVFYTSYVVIQLSHA